MFSIMLEGSLNFCGLKFVVYNIRDIPGRSIVDSFAMDPEDQYPEEISGQYAVLDGLVLISMVSSLPCSELLFLFCSEEVHVLCTHNIELLWRVVANEKIQSVCYIIYKSFWKQLWVKKELMATELFISWLHTKL